MSSPYAVMCECADATLRAGGWREPLRSPTGLAALPGLGMLVRERDMRRCRLLVAADRADRGVDVGLIASMSVHTSASPPESKVR